MKRILITGANSYIGTSFESWINESNSGYKIDKISVRTPNWRNMDFSPYDCIIHLAAIVHKNEQNEQLYNEINRDLTIDIAKKAKAESVKQFVFFSTMAVYGKNVGHIEKKTKINPSTFYGKSKYEAELLLKKLENDNFTVSIVRPPMIYGKNCPGNYVRLAKLAKKTLFFPNINNKRSMIYIDNLNKFIFLLIEYKASGIFHPQNASLVNTSQMVENIAKVHGKKVILISGFGMLARILSNYVSFLGKVFGDLTYSYELDGSPNSNYFDMKFEYNYIDFDKSIIQTEK